MDRHSDTGGGIDALCTTIVERDHASIRRALPRVSGLLAEVECRSCSPQLAALHAAFDDIAEQIKANLAKEENLLFPAITALSTAERGHLPPAPLPFVTLLHPIRVMETDHARIEQALDGLRRMARGISEPCSRTPAWQVYLAALAALEEELREHHFTENEVLFPRALELERRAL